MFGLARAQLTNTIFKHALSTCSAEYSGCAVPQPRRGAPDAIAFASRPELCSSLYVSDFSGSVGRFRSSGVVFEQRTEHIVVEIEPSSRFLFQCVVRVYRIGRFAKWAGASCFCVQTDYCRLAILSWFDSLSSGSSQARVFLFVTESARACSYCSVTVTGSVTVALTFLLLESKFGCPKFDVPVF